ncbi:MAG: polysaccharide biosynthesis/export protein [Blastocatellia bacterium]|jgi:polysaccharide export outer membrane protein|nr:polysaccharide biosynthesis/export protein [Blastocatellia bacterium]
MNWSNVLKSFALPALLLLLAAPLFNAQAQDGPLVSAPKKQAATNTATTTKQPDNSAQPNASSQPKAANAQPATTSDLTQLAPPPVSQGDMRYRIGAGDVIELRVLKAPELSRDSIRVDQRGMIRIPMIEDEVQAACLTEGELAQRIATLYLKYKNHPHVDVYVKEFQSQPVAVVGAVNAPGQFKLQRQVRLLDLLTYAGGPAERAGQSIQIVHAGGPSLCEKTVEPTEGETAMAGGFVTYRLNETLLGQPESNPYVRPGDIVSVLAADQVYVIGNVIKPTAIALKEPTTVSRAIAMAGGLGPDGKKSRVHIVRQEPGANGVKSDFYVDLAAIQKRKAEDVALQANDIIEVPTSTTKNIMHSLLGIIAPTVTQGAVRVIP